MKTGWSRREFAALAAGTVAAPVSVARSSAKALTAQDVVDRIKKQVGVDWNPETVDTFKAGDPASPVTGNAVTSLATLSVLDRAIPKGWIMLGHNISEEQGMLEMAQWIKGFVPEVPVQLVKAGEPFWAPR